ncbi:phosphatidylinositol-glycan biosynthesis class S protein-domain-containing protein [Schizophyllum amplum]|uniref:Phosphatidylinositol-glycan biosynthesis class S protein-domain-containing protein n=1 Tax=Schizophyllum amplum TaxID=97359 RepID=A0A550CFJ3_9AGAR|nr:phosphatidylinositol-glycan biosynthesis class S protein-domain-containing protein [Auriculariopsis ampla]
MSDNASIKEEDDQLKDPSKLYYQSNGVRWSIIASYWLVIFLALPLWWKTTSIERLSLPQSQMDAQSERMLRLSVALRSSEARVREALDRPAFREQLADEGVDVHVASGEKFDYEIALGNHQETYVEGRSLSFPEYVSDDEILDVLKSLLVPHAVNRQHEQHVVPFASRYQLSFSLLNEDAADGDSMLSWPIRDAIQRHLTPTVNDLANLYNFTFESQVQFHAPLAFEPEPISVHDDDESAADVEPSNDDMAGITSEQLTVFVNSAEWSLSSSVSNDPVLHFLLFVPKRPLHILTEAGELSSSRAFLIPQWGGVVLADTQDLTTDPARQVNAAFATFRAQLVTLLGVPQLPPNVTARVPPGHITPWQADALLRRRARESAQEARDTLRSISRLVNQIENMPVGARVRDDVQGALHALELAYSSASASMLAAFQHAAHATVLASRAFFSPGMLQLLYFPPEHIYAVYMPLFASALIPLAATAARELRAWRKGVKAAAQVAAAQVAAAHVAAA